MRSRLGGVEPGLAVARALSVGLCGIGGRLPRRPADLVEAVTLTEEHHGERAAARLCRFAEVPAGAQVWTRERGGDYRCGVLTGPWWYDVAPAAHLSDLVHVRSCRWAVSRDTPDVPDAVVETFRRGGRNFQRIRTLS